MRKAFALLITALVVSPAFAAKTSKTAPAKVIDSGSFGVFIGGRRVATEKFEIQQRSDMSVATAALHTIESGDKASQTTELDLSPAGDLIRYTWHEGAGDKAETTVEQKDEFLVQHILAGPEHKAAEVPHILPHSTMILDDFSFMQRELLAWRYLAGVCSLNPEGKNQCKQEKAQYGVLIPQQRVSSAVTLEIIGREKIIVKGVERDLIRINLTSETADWSLWLDDSNKMIRATINGQNTEILRD